MNSLELAEVQVPLITVKERRQSRSMRGEGKEKREYLNLSLEDEKYWGFCPPNEIIFATASVRKAYLLAHLLNGLKFHQEEIGEETFSPLKLQAYLDIHAFNGDGQLKEKTLICYFHGVPVYADPQKYETKSNNPYEQASRKADGLASEYKEMDDNVIVFAGDTVEIVSSYTESLGKPMNRDDFPKQSTDQDDTEYEAELRVYLNKLRDEIYQIGAWIENINAVVVIDLLTNEKRIQWFKLTQQIKENIHNAMMKIDAGGGGISQQLVDWDMEPELLLEELGSLFPQNLKVKILEQIEAAKNTIVKNSNKATNEKVIEYAAWLLFTQNIGVPGIGVVQMLDKLAETRRNWSTASKTIL